MARFIFNTLESALYNHTNPRKSTDKKLVLPLCNKYTEFVIIQPNALNQETSLFFRAEGPVHRAQAEGLGNGIPLPLPHPP